MPIGSRAIVISPWNLTSGPTSSDGSLNTPLLSSEPESSCGKKVTLPTLPSSKLKDKCMTILSSISESTNRSLLFQFAKESRLNLKNSQEDSELQLLRLGFQKMEEPFRLPLPTTSAKISQKCSAFNLKTLRKRRNLFGKLVGGWQLDQLESWLCITATIKDWFYLLESQMFRLSLFLFLLRENKQKSTPPQLPFSTPSKKLNSESKSTLEITTTPDGSSITGN